MRTKRSSKIGWRRPRDATVGDASRGADLHALKFACWIKDVYGYLAIQVYGSRKFISWLAGLLTDRRFLFSGCVGIIRQSRALRRFGRRPVVVFFCENTAATLLLPHDSASLITLSCQLSVFAVVAQSPRAN